MSRRRAAILLAILLLLVIAVVVLRPYLSWEFILQQEMQLRQLVSGHRWGALAAGLVVYTVASLIPGTSGKSIVVGWLFGFLAGLIVVNLGLTIAAIGGFLVGRHLLYAWMHRRFGEWMLRIDHQLAESEGVYLLTLRLLHAPYTLTNYLVGATRVSLRRFWWTTQLGLLPGNVAFVYAGASLPSLAEVSKQGVWSVIDFRLLAALTAVALLPVLIRWFVRRLNRSSGHEQPDLNAAPHDGWTKGA